jgi:hypothetical protein
VDDFDATSTIDARLSEAATAGLALSRLPPLAALYRRLAYAFQGDPCGDINAVSTGPTDVHGLPDNVVAVSAVIYVAGGAIIYRVAGTPPAAAGDQTVLAGSTIELTGQATIKGFLFAGAAGAVTLFGTYYD